MLAKGIDLSHWQRHTVPWADFRAMGYRFAILRVAGPQRCQEGGRVWMDYDVCVKDDKFDEHYRNAKSHNFLVGGFLFLTRDVDRQAMVAREAVGDKFFEMPFFCDAEMHDINLNRVDRFCVAMDRLLDSSWCLHSETGLYCNWWFYHRWNVGRWIDRRPLWPARPGIGRCDIHPWYLWQRGYVKVNGRKYDDNRYNGTLEELVVRLGDGGGQKEA